MEEKRFKALVVREDAEKKIHRAVEERVMSELPPGEVLIRVHFSSLNYKDALSANGNRGVTKNYPHTPGIDAAGVVAASTTGQFSLGDEVICMGYDLGMNTPGGFAEYVSVPNDWVLAKPTGLSLYEAMQIGTAGFTAAQCVERLISLGVRPDQGPVLVTGATGGVGSTAVALLSKLGFQVAAVTGKESEHAFLQKLGAQDVLTRKQAIGRANAALLRERWAGVVDTVGGDVLAGAIKATRYGGIVTSCGNAASGDLSLTVYPFILRSVCLIGIDSASCPMIRREEIWQDLADGWRLNILDGLTTRITLDQLTHFVEDMLAGKTTGRIVVDLGGTE
ncbi:MAG: YhdH/YhfP family quinone oxidoreductase [Candidatus Electrothrix scaldis]|jgi:putative YhdH/YhfP family quinone oxidoreductase|nr:MAG: YhdH/YhfP family quinone oxidoreductase [Candidatus Electrothrix sp. GW3-3]